MRDFCNKCNVNYQIKDGTSGCPYCRIAELEQRIEAAARWRTDLPSNLDECMEIVVELKGGWYRCIGYVLQDLSITDFDQNDVGYTWGDGCYWRPVPTDHELEAALREGEQDAANDEIKRLNQRIAELEEMNTMLNESNVRIAFTNQALQEKLERLEAATKVLKAEVRYCERVEGYEIPHSVIGALQALLSEQDG